MSVPGSDAPQNSAVADGARNFRAPGVRWLSIGARSRQVGGHQRRASRSFSAPLAWPPPCAPSVVRGARCPRLRLRAPRVCSGQPARARRYPRLIIECAPSLSLTNSRAPPPASNSRPPFVVARSFAELAHSLASFQVASRRGRRAAASASHSRRAAQAGPSPCAARRVVECASPPLAARLSASFRQQRAGCSRRAAIAGGAVLAGGGCPRTPTRSTSV